MQVNEMPTVGEAMANGLIPAIATLWPNQGGRNGGLMRGINGSPDYFLIYADDPAAESELEWGGYGKEEPGAKSDHDGLVNTLALIASEHDHPASRFAGEARIGGFSDWYIPARREWRVLVGNVPEAFKPDWYWSSTQYTRFTAWMQHCAGGVQFNAGKDSSRRVRLVRRLFL